ncbi:MAG TPA: DUF1579 domain-containing protein [Tepidisphaeraceae bacterium]|jgi:hypothetical protein|nr:DUF1579 domain-containing protein [Tepidisphaeraceae bacterium]
MKKVTIAGFVLALLTIVGVRAAEELPKLPPPQKEHEWLKQLAGDWEVNGEMYMEQGKPPMKNKGSESARMIGGFWVVAENKGTMMDTPMTGIMTLGFDPEKKKYVGTWVDSMAARLWQYEGTLDPTQKILTLETEGPCPLQGGKITKFKEVIEIKDKDHRTFTSNAELDGKWVTMFKAEYQRKSQTAASAQ